MYIHDILVYIYIRVCVSVWFKDVAKASPGSHSQKSAEFTTYDCFHSKCDIPDIPVIHQIEKLRFLGISQCKLKFKSWSNLNLY